MAHVSVLLQATLDGLNLQKGATVVDGTFGGGGHSKAIAERIGTTGTLISFDRDATAFHNASITELKAACQFHAVVEDFRYLEKALHQFSVGNIDAAIYDLGLSSNQLDGAGRGFSFQRDEPLLMTMSVDREKQVVTAYDVVNRWSESTLVTIFRGFADERFAGRIARAIITAREVAPITTTGMLASIVSEAVPKRKQLIHPATRVFQAIRMAVNDELPAIEAVIPQVVERLRVGGRLAMITFHSIEDRTVKHAFQRMVRESRAVLVNKKPIVPSVEEISSNPRARSAKLRILEKIAYD